MIFSLSYLKYLWSSNNQHGVHSPFVYQLLTKALYQNLKAPQSEFFKSWQIKHHITNRRKIRIITRALNYFNDSGFDKAHMGMYTYNKSLFINLIDEIDFKIDNQISKHPFIIVDHINKRNIEWQKFCKDPKITLSVDFYNIGFLFYKPGQHKENFKIRI